MFEFRESDLKGDVFYYVIVPHGKIVECLNTGITILSPVLATEVINGHQYIWNA